MESVAIWGTNLTVYATLLHPRCCVVRCRDLCAQSRGNGSWRLDPVTSVARIEVASFGQRTRADFGHVDQYYCVRVHAGFGHAVKSYCADFGRTVFTAIAKRKISADFEHLSTDVGHFGMKMNHGTDAGFGHRELLYYGLRASADFGHYSELFCSNAGFKHCAITRSADAISGHRFKR